MDGSRAVPYGDASSRALAGERPLQADHLRAVQGQGKTSVGELLGGLGRALAQGDPAAHHYLLLLRFLLANVLALALSPPPAMGGST